MSEITVKEVVDTQTGDVIKSSTFFQQDESDIFKQRGKLEQAIQNKIKLWICPVCGEFIWIKGKKDGLVSLHFVHKANKDNTCPLKEKHGLSKKKLLAYKYNGQKEGERHKFLKELIASKIEADNRFSEPRVEKRINGASGEWRKPDVRTEFEGKSIAFEVQLSTTFLSVIRERKNFYRKQGIYLIWIFDRYHSAVENMRFSEKDIFFPNHHNAFFIDKDDAETKFNLICGYEVPIIKQDKIKRKFITKKIAFDDLTFDSEYESYFFNYDAEKHRIEINIFLNRLEKATRQDEVKALCKSHADLFKQHNISPDDRDSPRLRALISCILSIKKRRVVGYGHKKVVEILHIFIEVDKQKKNIM
jgi:competence CoiA-like predicted nuclease